jgi:alkyl hydroperoxide reductase subunit F
MLDATLKSQLTAYLQNLREPIALVATLGDGAGAADMKALLEDVASTSDKVSLNFAGDDARAPSFAVTRAAGNADVRFAGLPLGHEFTSLVLASRSAPSRAPSASRPTSPSPARTAPTWCRR